MAGHHVHKCHWCTNVVKCDYVTNVMCYDVLIAASSWLHACNMGGMGTSNGVQPCDPYDD
jgi:hypothetical protein